MTPQSREELRLRASAAGVSLQTYLEHLAFGTQLPFVLPGEDHMEEAQIAV